MTVNITNWINKGFINARCLARLIVMLMFIKVIILASLKNCFIKLTKKE